ncbi:helix-turn-helix transcriptional regulator [Kocuria sp. CPCC 205300]|uniref:helix-turn-helix transcriptional regulator n=1 Tax=Kocuria sabuli TaxID=3071448 RepID=UPI0036D7CC48
MDPDDRLLTPAELAEWRGSTVRSLAQERYMGRGPKFLKLGTRTVRYRVKDVRVWLDENTRSITEG